MEGGKNGPAQSFPTPLLRRNVQLAKANKKIPVFPVPWPTLKIQGRLETFFPKKKIRFFVSQIC